MKKIILMTALTLLGAAAHSNAQVWTQPYTNGSTTDNIIRFNNGAAGQVTAPNPAFVVGVGYSSAQANGLGGGWNIEASGSVALGVGIVVVGRSNADTQVTTQNLRFGFETSGLSQLVALSLPMTWNAHSTITGSNTWATTSNSYRYNFDAVLNNSLVSGHPDIFGNINLTIRAGATELYNVTGLAQILGIVSITNSVYNDVHVNFTYNQASGPLEIIWSAGSTVDLALLNLLGNGNSLMYQVNNTSIQMDSIPEASSYCLILGGAGVLCIFLRRKV